MQKPTQRFPLLSLPRLGHVATPGHTGGCRCRTWAGCTAWRMLGLVTAEMGPDGTHLGAVRAEGDSEPGLSWCPENQMGGPPPL